MLTLMLLLHVVPPFQITVKIFQTAPFDIFLLLLKLQRFLLTFVRSIVFIISFMVR